MNFKQLHRVSLYLLLLSVLSARGLCAAGSATERRQRRTPARTHLLPCFRQVGRPQNGKQWLESRRGVHRQRVCALWPATQRRRRSARHVPPGGRFSPALFAGVSVRYQHRAGQEECVFDPGRRPEHESAGGRRLDAAWFLSQRVTRNSGGRVRWLRHYRSRTQI